MAAPDLLLQTGVVFAALATRPAVALPQGDTIAALAVGYVLVMGLLGTVLMRYSGTIERRVAGAGGGGGGSSGGSGGISVDQGALTAIPGAARPAS